MREKDIIEIIIDNATYVHEKLGPFLDKTLYRKCLRYKLSELQLQVEDDKPIKIEFEKQGFDSGYKADLVIEDKVIVMFNTNSQIDASEELQLKYFMKWNNVNCGIMLNFNVPKLLMGTKILNLTNHR